MTDLPTPPARAARMEKMLRDHFQPTLLEIVDDSARHAGHSGAAPAGETHFNVTLVSALFAGLSRVQRSRAVHDILSQELQDGLHALALKLRAPGE
jgi:BolA family transcriptional regulator, general stress-responsive regulator